MSGIVDALRGGLVVSCQAPEGHPLRDASVIGALAQCAERGGAAGVRVNGPEDVAEVKKRVSLPVIGLHKVPSGVGRPLITPTFDHARALAEAGADVVALEAASENRPDVQELERLVRRVGEGLGLPVMADVSTLEEGMRAWEVGAELVATTLSGHTRASRDRGKPDLGLVGELAEAGVRVVCEGHVRTPEQVERAFGLGAFCVVVGAAITDPQEITARFVAAVGEPS